MPWPPFSISTRFASYMAWYSGVSGGFCPRFGVTAGGRLSPQRNPPAPPAIRPRLVVRHCPFRFGYFESSAAEAEPTVIASAARAAMQIELGKVMGLLRSH